MVVDNAAGTRLAIQHLYNLGHSKIAFIKGPDILVDSIQRWQGLELFAEEVGLELKPELILQIREKFHLPRSLRTYRRNCCGSAPSSLP